MWFALDQILIVGALLSTSASSEAPAGKAQELAHKHVEYARLMTADGVKFDSDLQNWIYEFHARHLEVVREYQLDAEAIQQLPPEQALELRRHLVLYDRPWREWLRECDYPPDQSCIDVASYISGLVTAMRGSEESLGRYNLMTILQTALSPKLIADLPVERFASELARAVSVFLETAAPEDAVRVLEGFDSTYLGVLPSVGKEFKKYVERNQSLEPAQKQEFLKKASRPFSEARALELRREAEEDTIRDVLDAWEAAVQDRRWSAAVSLLSQSTIDYYARVRDLVLYGSRAELKQQSTMVLTHVLHFRHLVPVSEMPGPSGRQMLEYALRRGWVGNPNKDPGLVVGVEVADHVATATIMPDEGSWETYDLSFIKDIDGWKLDLAAGFEEAGLHIDRLLKEQGISREEVLLKSLHSTTGKTVAETIWDPPLQREKQDAPPSRNDGETDTPSSARSSASACTVGATGHRRAVATGRAVGR